MDVRFVPTQRDYFSKPSKLKTYMRVVNTKSMGMQGDRISIGMIQIEIAIGIGIESDVIIIEALHFDFGSDSMGWLFVSLGFRISFFELIVNGFDDKALNLKHQRYYTPLCLKTPNPNVA
jgi:hypothetical protein